MLADNENASFFEFLIENVDQETNMVPLPYQILVGKSHDLIKCTLFLYQKASNSIIVPIVSFFVSIMYHFPICFSR